MFFTSRGGWFFAKPNPRLCDVCHKTSEMNLIGFWNGKNGTKEECFTWFCEPCIARAFLKMEEK